MSLLAFPEAVPELRHHLRGHGFDVRLCATELLTNVIDYLGEGTPVTVRVTGTDDGHTRVEVTDTDPRALPVLAPAAGTAESGRGLTLVGALSRRWGVDPGAGRKTVWCEVRPLPREEERAGIANPVTALSRRATHSGRDGRSPYAGEGETE
ncbi:ATP-binding protein [Streptomyces sp. TG1A-8]|nr:ATP-binding protein [Streptomyces sp. TG1A-8]MDO0927983.1 ATP-binding protein [Streptomyces sp. TG1A-8]